MFERLFNRKNVFSYIPALLMAFCGLPIGINPFSNAVFAVMVEEKVPVLIPFLFTSIIQLFLFGYESALRFLSFAVVYSLIKAFSKNKQKFNSDDIFELLKKDTLRVLISALLSEGILLLTGVEETPDYYSIFCMILSTVAFSVVFSYAYKYYYALINDTDRQNKFIHVSSFMLMCIVCLSILKSINILNINLWIVFSVILLMIAVWRKNLVFGIIASLLASLILVLIANAPLGIVVLMLVAGIVTTLLSKAGRKGALIGFVFLFVILMFVVVNNSNNDITLNGRVQKDYYDFLIYSQKFLSGDELQKTEEEIARIEELTRLQEESKNTLSSLVIRCMLIGFFILCIIPDKFLSFITNKIPDAPNPKQIKERLFRVSKIYWLNPAKEEKEKK